MGYADRLVQLETNELTIVQRFVQNVLTDCDVIKCIDDNGNVIADTDSYLSEQYQTTSNRPSFILRLLDNCRLQFVRSEVLSDAGNYTVSFIGANGTEYSLGTVYFSNYVSYPSTVETKRFKYKIVFNSQFIHFSFFGYSLYRNFAVCDISDGTISASSYTTDSDVNPIYRAFIFPDNTTSGLYNRLQYKQNELNKIEILKNKVFWAASNEPIRGRTTAIYDCNYNNDNQQFVIDGKIYITVGNFTLVQIGDA